MRLFKKRISIYVLSFDLVWLCLCAAGDKWVMWRSQYRYQVISGMLCAFGWVKVVLWDLVKSDTWLPSYSPLVTYHYITENRRKLIKAQANQRERRGGMLRCTVWALWWAAYVPGGRKTDPASLRKCFFSLSTHWWPGLNSHTAADHRHKVCWAQQSSKITNISKKLFYQERNSWVTSRWDLLGKLRHFS